MESESRFPATFVILAVAALLFMLAPAVVTLAAAFNAGNYLQFPPHGLSFRWIEAFLTSPLFLDNFVFSFKLALVVTVIATLLGTAAAVGLLRAAFPGREAVRVMLLAPIVLPGMVLGLALLAYYAALKLPLMRSYWGLVVAHVLVATPFVFALVSAALARFDVSLEEAARSMGAGPIRAFWDVTLKINSQAILAGSTFAFIVSFGQFDTSLFLAGADMLPLPVALFNSIKFRTDPTIAAAGVFSIATVVASTVLLYFLTSARRRKVVPSVKPT